MTYDPITETGTLDGASDREHPETIGAYTVLGFLGDTASGPVYRVTKAGSKDVYSLKLLAAEMLIDNPMAHQELPKLGRLRHPGIARVHDVVLDGEAPHILVEFIPGMPLRDLMARRRLSFPQAFRIFKQVCEALEAAHRQDVLHRSLDPAKVLVTEDLSMVRLVDFAVGALSGGKVDVSSAGTQMMRGMNLVYRAPETLKQGIAKSGPRADVYSAGVVFYELLTGRKPGGRLSLPSQLNSEVPPDLDAVVLRCLSVNPKDRYKDFSEVLSDLRILEDRLRLGLAHNLQGISRTTTRLLVNKEGNKRVPTGVLIALALLAVAAVVLVAGLLLPERSPPEGAERVVEAPEPLSATDEGPGDAGDAGDGATDPAAVSSNEGDAPGGSESITDPSSAGSAEAVESAPELNRSSTANPPPSRPPRRAATAPVTSAPTTAEAVGDSEAVEADATTEAEEVREKVALDLEVARQKIEAGLADAALQDLEESVDPALGDLPDDSPLRVQTEYVRSEALAAAGRLDDAKAVLVEVAVRHQSVEAIGESQTRLAELTLSSDAADRYQQASQIYHQLAERLPNTLWAPRALAAAADLEKRHGWMVRDPQLGEVPAQVRTLRLLAERHPRSSETVGRLKPLAEACEELKSFQCAADAYWQLGESTGSSTAWWHAGRLLDRRLDQDERALEAYRQVAQDSEFFADAQKRIRRID